MADGARNLRINPFIVAEDHLATGEKWEEWIEELEREMRFFKIRSSEDKRDALLIFGGPEIRRLDKCLPETEESNTYIDLKTKLTNYFAPKKNVHYARYVFLKTTPLAGESIVSFAMRLRDKANSCEFRNCDDRILEQIIQTTLNKDLIRNIIRKKWSLEQTLTEMQIMEETEEQVRAMNMRTTSDVARINRMRPNRAPGLSEHQLPDRDASLHEQNKKLTCKYCGKIHPWRKDECPAYGKKCSKCGKFNHFASVCKSNMMPTNQQRYRYNTDRNVHRMFQNCEESNPHEMEDDIFIGDSIRHLQQLQISSAQMNRVSDFEKTVPIVVNDVYVYVEPDSGADANVMDEFQFKTFKKKSSVPISLNNSTTKLRTLQNKLNVIGEFTAIARNQTRGTETRFIVIGGKINSAPLLGRQTLIDLGMLMIQPDGSLKKQNAFRIPNQVEIKSVLNTQEANHIDEIMMKYEDIFKGIGKIQDKQTGEEVVVKFSMKADATPVAQKLRPVPYYLQEPLKRWIDECIEEDIFERVQDGEAVTWCSPLVVQPKPRYSEMDKTKLEPHMIRASVDLRVPNKFMERSRILQSPVVEDFTYKFHDCTVFSKMDLKQGYHQLVLHPDSRKFATFSTPWGNMRPKRLIFGAKSSQDLFDEAMYRIFGDIPNCLNQRDDILIGGKTLEDHNKTLETVLERARRFGVTFNKEKCQFGVTELEFYGYKFTKDGLKPTEGKVRAVKEAKPPKSKEEVRSFLGMIGFLSKFIPNYAVLTAPLRRLTKQNIPFKWGIDENQAFEKLKSCITDDNTMAFFDPDKKIIVRVEASFNEGLSAGLFQKTAKGIQPVHYISRSLTDTEKRYSQTEKDALAVKWAKNRFRIYLLGAPKFQIISSHKPLIPMFNKTSSKLPPRIEKWVMDMQDVDYELVYEPGKDAADPMDYLSRHPLPETETDDTEAVVKLIVENEHGVVLDRIRKATSEDILLQDVISRMRLNDWEKHNKRPDLKPYFLIRHDLYTSHDLLFRAQQIVIPEKLKSSVIKAAHSMGHFGMTKTKQMLRARYWFLLLNGLVEDAIKRCYECQITTKEHRQEPVIPSEIPEAEWHTVSVDFGGPYPDGHYNLVVIDKRSRFPVVEHTTSTSAKVTVDRLSRIFASYGIPERIESDNGPPFNSTEFAKFSEIMGFKHHRVTPEHPRANGEAESFMKILNKTEQIAHMQRKSSQLALQELLMGYRSTPHPATGYTPYEALMKRNVRTKLDYKNPQGHILNQRKMERNITINDEYYKQKWRNDIRHPQCKSHNFKIGDKVLLSQSKRNKWTTPYEKNYYIIFQVNGSAIGARRHTDGRVMHRDASKFKLIPDDTADREMTDWRGKVMGAIPDQPIADVMGAIPYQPIADVMGAIPDQPIAEPRNTPELDINPNNQDDFERRIQPQRERRLPSRYRDCIVDF